MGGRVWQTDGEKGSRSLIREVLNCGRKACVSFFLSTANRVDGKGLRETFES